MKILAVFSCICFVTAHLHAAAPYIDSIPAKRHKISHQQFLDKYGQDDTARAVIDYFFHEHKKATRGIIPYTLITAGGITLYATAIAGGNAGTVIIIGTIIILITVICATFLLGSLVDLVKFSRKRLLKILDNYFSGNGIRRRLKKNLYSQKSHF